MSARELAFMVGFNAPPKLCSKVRSASTYADTETNHVPIQASYLRKSGNWKTFVAPNIWGGFWYELLDPVYIDGREISDHFGKEFLNSEALSTGRNPLSAMQLKLHWSSQTQI